MVPAGEGNGVGVASPGVELGAAGDTSSTGAVAVGAGEVIGSGATSTVGSGVGAWAGTAVPSTAAYIAAAAKPAMNTRRIMRWARTRAGRGGR